MDCTEVKNNLSALIDGEVTDSEREKLLSHIAECEDCRNEYAELRQLKKDISRLNVQLKSALADSVMKKISAETLPEKKKSPFFVRYIGTAAALIIIAGVFFYSRLAPANNKSEESAVQDAVTESERIESDLTYDSATDDSEETFDSVMALPETPMASPLPESEAVAEDSANDLKGNGKKPETPALKSEEYKFAIDSSKLEDYRFYNSIAPETAIIFVDSEVDELLPLFDNVSSVTANAVNIPEPHTEVINILLSNSIKVTSTDLPMGAKETVVFAEANDDYQPG